MKRDNDIYVELNKTNSLLRLIVMLINIILIILIYPIFSEASELSDEEIIVKEIAWEVLHIIDWGTTLDIAKHPDKYYEFNPILGEHPSVNDVNIYMGTSAILHPLITHWLPNKYIYIYNFKFNPKRIWLNTSLFVSGSCVINNFAVGLKINF